MADVYGFNEAKSKIAVVDKATQDAKDASQDTSITNNNITAVTPTVDADNNLTIALSKGDGTQLTGSVELPSGGIENKGGCVGTGNKYYSVDSILTKISSYTNTTGTAQKLSNNVENLAKLAVDNSMSAYLTVQPNVTHTLSTVSSGTKRGIDNVVFSVDNDIAKAAILRCFKFQGSGSFSITFAKIMYYSNAYYCEDATGVVKGTYNDDTITITSNGLNDSTECWFWFSSSSPSTSTTVTIYRRLMPISCTITSS